MELKDFIPEKPTFTLASKGKTYTLRIPNLEDKIEMVRLCGGEDEVGAIFKTRNWSMICRLVYRLLIEKEDFLAKRETRITDEGTQEELLITGPIMLLRALGTQQEAMQMLAAFNSASVASEPLVKDFIEAEVKKNISAASIGENSPTSLEANTDTLPPISEPSPLAS